jgi:hypothetical protein
MDEFTLTDQEIGNLIQCPKKIVDSPKKEMQLANGHWRNDMRLQSIDGAYDYSVFMRKNEDFEENFSIGLVYYPRNSRGDIHLLRFNGPHGPHALFDHHDRFHIHQANQADMDSGMKAERTAYITKEYASYQDALGFLLKKCNIINAEEYFKGVLQHNLFPQQGGE